MSLPQSINEPNPDPAKVLAETLATKDPFGVPTLSIKPEDYAGLSRDALLDKLKKQTDAFFAGISNGDADKARHLAALFADEERYGYMRYRAERAAGDPKYSDAHAACINDTEGGAPLAGMTIRPRAGKSFADFAAYLTATKKEQFAPFGVSEDEARVLTQWHEFAHCAGANEPQAEKMGALVAKKAFGDTPLLQAQADVRVIDALYSYRNSYHRLKNYGWPVVEALDAVIAMPAAEVRNMSEKDILATLKDGKPDPHIGAAKKLGAIIAARAPQAMKNHDLAATGLALRQLLAENAFGPADGVLCKMAGRSLLAIEHVSRLQPGLKAAFGPSARALPDVSSSAFVTPEAPLQGPANAPVPAAARPQAPKNAYKPA